MTESPVVTFDLSINVGSVAPLVTRFQNFATKTARGILEMGRVVFEASKLSTSEFAKFCELVGMDKKQSTVNKLKAIGEKYEFLLAHASKLPSSWTTVYEVAKLTEYQISNLIDTGVINTNLMANELNVALGKPIKITKPSTKPAVTDDSFTDLGFRVRLKKSPDEELTSRIQDLLEQLRSLNLEVEIGSSLEVFFETAEVA